MCEIKDDIVIWIDDFFFRNLFVQRLSLFVQPTSDYLGFARKTIHVFENLKYVKTRSN